MFRGNSLATKAMEAYMKLVADDYLQVKHTFLDRLFKYRLSEYSGRFHPKRTTIRGFLRSRPSQVEQPHPSDSREEQTVAHESCGIGLGQNHSEVKLPLSRIYLNFKLERLF